MQTAAALGRRIRIIEEMHVLAEPGASSFSCEAACINPHFFLGISQSFSSERFFEGFPEELRDAGLDCAVLRKEPLRMCGIANF